MYIAQATGSSIVTDSSARWREFIVATERGDNWDRSLKVLQAAMEKTEFILPHDALEIAEMHGRGLFRGYSDVIIKLFNHLSGARLKPASSNFEAGLTAEFNRANEIIQKMLSKSGAAASKACLSCLWINGGIQDNSINRLLLMSNSETYLSSVPMAFFVKTKK